MTQSDSVLLDSILTVLTQLALYINLYVRVTGVDLTPGVRSRVDQG